MAWIADIAVEDWQARCLREKRARKRRARGELSEVSFLRRARIWESSGSVGMGDIAEGAMFAVVVFGRWWRRCSGVGGEKFMSEKSQWRGRKREGLFCFGIGWIRISTKLITRWRVRISRGIQRLLDHVHTCLF